MSVSVILDCDADRDGTVGENEEGKANWTWGEGGLGAIVLVDNDADSDPAASLDEREPIIVRPLGVEELPAGYSFRLSTAAEAALNLSVLRKTASGYEKVLGLLPGEPLGKLVIAADVNPKGETLYVSAHSYPGPYFEGLLLFKLELTQELDQGQRLLAADRILMRVAPWIMTPNTLPAERVYTTRIEHGPDNNSKFLMGLSDAISTEGIELEIIEAVDHRGDRWIQDEIEIGYARSHRGALPVVFDSPRDRGLDDYPEAKMLGPDFGHFVVGGGIPNSLDSFGNLEVSPPVVVNGKAYPLGRVIVGGRQEGDFSHDARQMMAEVRQFLFAQRVQFPFEIFTDWLAVAHVDEIICFVPSEVSPKRFKCLVASTRAVREILEKLSNSGHGAELCFAGKKRRNGDSAEITVDELLANAEFWQANAEFQSIMDDNKAILSRELGLDDEDMVDIPVAFYPYRDDQGRLERTLAYFPDMVNHLVHKDLSIVPKPYGPLVDGKCAFEKAFEDALQGRRVKFIDDWDSYHELSGEVHCGTNALRTPFTVSRWWHTRPEGGFDIKTLQF